MDGSGNGALRGRWIWFALATTVLIIGAVGVTSDTDNASEVSSKAALEAGKRETLDRAAVSTTPGSSASKPDLLTTAAGTGSWFSVVTGRIANDEHRFVENERSPGAFLGYNRAQRLDVRIDHEGVEVHGRLGTATFSWSYRLAGVGRRGDMSPTEESSPVIGDCSLRSRVGTDGACLERLEYHRDGVVEYYDNLAAGLQHGVIVENAPDGEGPLVLAGVVGGGLFGRVSAKGDAVFYDGRRDLLRYGGLRVEDAAGRELDAWLEAGDGSLDIVVDDSGAAYPLHVDPILEMATENLVPPFPGITEAFGFSVAAAGDVNDDGYMDVVVGAPFWGTTLTPNQGRAYLFYGSGSGLGTTSAWDVEGGQTDAHLGYAVAAAGDVDGDGCGDIAVGVPGWNGGAYTASGKVPVFHGCESGGVPDTTADQTLFGRGNGARLGASVAAAGDVNADGYGDLIVGAPGAGTSKGLAYVYHGSTSGLSSSAAWWAQGWYASDAFGTSVSSAGDVNGDGYSDVIVGAPKYWTTDIGRAAVFYGSSTGLGSWPSRSIYGLQASEQLGYSVAAAGDVDGNGYGDVIIGVPYRTTSVAGAGRAVIHYGSSSGISATAGSIFDGTEIGARLGHSVAGAGDVNGDGYADVIVGAPDAGMPASTAGRALVWFGRAGGIPNGPVPDWDQGGLSNDQLGFAVSSAGDVEGDGFDDVIIGAPGETNDDGVAHVFHGYAEGLRDTWSVSSPGENSGDKLGTAVASAGDVDGDGYGDVIVGAPYYDPPGLMNAGRAYLFMGTSNGLSFSTLWTAEGASAGANFGFAVDGAGDLDGDGYADVIIGAPEESSGDGAAYVYYSCANTCSEELDTSPGWTFNTGPSGARCGYDVAGAGDVNGDGYTDFIFGCPEFGAFGGLAYGFHGHPTGAPVFAWIDLLSPTQAGARFGHAVAFAGDVNRDGYADVVVGAPDWDAPGGVDNGVVYAYLGSASGLGSAPTTMHEASSAMSSFGFAVAAAGHHKAEPECFDDHYPHVIVGAPEAGEFYLLCGSDTGLPSNGGISNLAHGVCGASDRFGHSVGSADIDGDGFAEILVGAPGPVESCPVDPTPSSAAGVVLGYDTIGSWMGGLSSDHFEWFLEGPSAGSEAGTSFGVADVDGDGYADVIAGAPEYSSDYGWVGVFRGGYDIGYHATPKMAARALRTGSDDPIPPFGRSDSSEGFRVRVNASSAFGRTRVKLQVEVKSYNLDFDDTSLSESASWTDLVPGHGAVVLTLLVKGLKEDRAYHWRARLIYEHPQGFHSHWVYGGISGQPSAVHLRTAAP